MSINLVYTKPHILHQFLEEQIKYCNQKSKKFESVTFLPIIYKGVTKYWKRLSESEKM